MRCYLEKGQAAAFPQSLLGKILHKLGVDSIMGAPSLGVWNTLNLAKLNIALPVKEFPKLGGGEWKEWQERSGSGASMLGRHGCG